MKTQHTQIQGTRQAVQRGEFIALHKTETKELLFLEISKIDKSLAKLTKRWRNFCMTLAIKGASQQTQRKYRKSKGHTLNFCTPPNWKTKRNGYTS